MIKAVSLSEAEILEELVGPADSSLSRCVAQELLSLEFSVAAKKDTELEQEIRL